MYLHGFAESVGKVELFVLEALHCEETTFEDQPFSPSSQRDAGGFPPHYPERGRISPDLLSPPS